MNNIILIDIGTIPGIHVNVSNNESNKKSINFLFQVYPGINDAVINTLQIKASTWPDSSKLCALVLDEMSIKSSLSYDRGRDMVEGFIPGGKELVNYALVFMVRGIVRKWKQAIAYFLSSSPMSGSQTKNHLLDCINRLQGIGLKVVVIIGDQGSNNVNLFEKQLAATVIKPYFEHQSNRIFVMYDPPHLLKNIRNNMKKHGYIVTEVNDQHEILWDHVQAFYELDSSKPIRLAPKLTRKHIEMPAFSQLSVSRAAQVLSHSVATGLHVMAQWEKLPGTCNF